MTRNVILLDANNSVSGAWQWVQQHPFRHMPVVNADKKLVGILSSHDILLALHQYSASILSESITTIMITQVITAGPETRVRRIAEVMVNHNIGCVPVVADNDQVIGIVTRTDILRSVMHEAPLELWT